MSIHPSTVGSRAITVVAAAAAALAGCASLGTREGAPLPNPLDESWVRVSCLQAGFRVVETGGAALRMPHSHALRWAMSPLAGRGQCHLYGFRSASRGLPAKSLLSRAAFRSVESFPYVAGRCRCRAGRTRIVEGRLKVPGMRSGAGTAGMEAR